MYLYMPPDSTRNGIVAKQTPPPDDLALAKRPPPPPLHVLSHAAVGGWGWAN